MKEDMPPAAGPVFQRQIPCHLRKLEDPSQPGIMDTLTIAVGVRGDETYLSVSSEGDLFFYYEFSATESEFASMREEQGFIFEYSQLPEFLAKIMDDAARDPETFMLRILLAEDGNTARAELIQNISSFKYVEICHLELSAGSIDEVKESVLARYNALRLENQSLTAQVAELKKIIRARLPNAKLGPP